MNGRSGLLRTTVTMVRVVYVLSLVMSIVMPLIMVSAAVFPEMRDAGHNRFGIESGSLRVDFGNTVDPKVWGRGIFVAYGLGTLGVWTLAYILNQLSAFLKQIEAGAPFAPGNAGRVGRIGLAVIALGVGGSIGGYAVVSYFAAYIAAPGITLQPKLNLPIGPVLIGLVILCLAAAFRHGAGLQEEHDLTV